MASAENGTYGTILGALSAPHLPAPRHALTEPKCGETRKPVFGGGQRFALLSRFHSLAALHAFLLACARNMPATSAVGRRRYY